MVRAVCISGLMLVVSTIGSFAEEADLNGIWKSETGAVYQIFQKHHSLQAFYKEPNETQQKTGIKAGDVAFVGEIIGRVISGNFHQKISMEEAPQCKASEWLDAPINFEVLNNGNRIVGDLIRQDLDEDCVIVDRWLQRLTIDRMP